MIEINHIHVCFVVSLIPRFMLVVSLIVRERSSPGAE